MASQISQVRDEEFNSKWDNQGQTGRQALVAEIVVPRARVWRLTGGPGMGWSLRLAVRSTFDLPAQAGRTTYVADLGFGFPDPSYLPVSDRVYAEFVEAGVVTASGVVGYDPVAGTVTANVTANAGQLRVDVLMPTGTVLVRKFAPFGHGATVESTVLQQNLRYAHAINQHKMPIEVEGDHLLIQDWGLRIYLEAPHVISWDSPITQVSIPYWHADLSEFDRLLRQQGLDLARFAEIEVARF